MVVDPATNSTVATMSITRRHPRFTFPVPPGSDSVDDGFVHDQTSVTVRAGQTVRVNLFISIR